MDLSKLGEEQGSMRCNEVSVEGSEASEWRERRGASRKREERAEERKRSGLSNGLSVTALKSVILEGRFTKKRDPKEEWRSSRVER